MYNGTKWQNRVVDADSGEIIQRGTSQSAGNFNNMENGITDAHVAGALMLTAVRHRSAIVGDAYVGSAVVKSK